MKCLFSACWLLLIIGVARAENDSYYAGPLDAEAITWTDDQLTDPVAQLKRDLEAGRLTLTYEPGHGYLRSLLEALNIPIESQVLVFSRTSFQNSRISPATPRALYFNDSVYVGWVQGGDMIEIASVDPRYGTIFWVLEQKPGATFAHNAQCLQCHQAARTLGVPGPIVRSVFTHPRGFPILTADYFDVNHRTELKDRWGGYYVTGTHGEQRHMGNQTVRSATRAAEFNGDAGANVTDLAKFFDTGPYLSPHSDILALMVLEHQVHLHNLLTVAAFETRVAMERDRATSGRDEVSEATRKRIAEVGEAVVRYMLMADEVFLTDPIEGTSDFAKVFEARGRRDSKGRSLRDLDMRRAMFKHPCSYLIYSEAFDNLPDPVRAYVLRRMYDLLSGRVTDHSFMLSTPQRRAILEILRETKPNLPSYWHD